MKEPMRSEYNCKYLERQLARMMSTSTTTTTTTTTTTPSPDISQNQRAGMEVFTMRPMIAQHNANTNRFPPMTLTSQNNYNPFTKYIQELALINPYDHPDNKIFKDPDIFPPFNVQQQQGYIPLPVKPAYHEEHLKTFYALANGRNITNVQTSYGSNYIQSESTL